MTALDLDNLKGKIKDWGLGKEFPARGSGYKGYTFKTLTFWNLSLPDKALFLKRNTHAPEGDFEKQANDLMMMHLTVQRMWGESFATAIQETFGRQPEFADYKVSGIGRDEFSEARKNELRELAHLLPLISGLAFASKLATGCRFPTAKNWYRDHPTQAEIKPGVEDLAEEDQTADRPRG